MRINASNLQDCIKKTRINATTVYLKKTDYWRNDQLYEYRLQKLISLVDHCYYHVPYYTCLFDRIGLKPSDIKSLEDIRKIPVLTKEILRKEQEEFIPINFDINDENIKKTKTIGATGAPFCFYQDTQTRDYSLGAYYRWYNWMGVKTEDKIAVLWGASTALSSNVNIRVGRLSNTLTINSAAMNDFSLPLVAEQLIEFKPVLLKGHLSAILKLATYLKKNKLSLPSIKSISSISETLLPNYRKFIEKVFHVKMFEEYGCAECKSIAFECKAHNGLHITEEHCIVEVLDDDNNPCTGVRGRIVVTDLDNHAFPFIRYENGDSAVMKESKCTCGRASSLLSDISGSKDVIFLNDGRAVTVDFFTDIFHELGYDNFRYFLRFQIYQKKEGSFICRLEKTGIILPKGKLDELLSTFSRYGNDIQIEVLDKLENDKSGKFRYVISEIDNY